MLVWKECAVSGAAAAKEPEPTVNRRRLAALLLLALLPPWPLAGATAPALAAGPGDVAVQTTEFQDIAGDPYAPAIDVLAGMGIVRGVSDTAFQPKAPVTREQLAAFVVRLLDYQRISKDVSDVPPSFGDASSIDPWAVGDVNVVDSLRLMSGYPDGFFHPHRTVGEADALAVLVRVLGGGNYANGLSDGWPANYLTAATALGLLNSVTLRSPDGSAPVRRDELAQMLFNAGMANLVTYDPNGNAILPPAGKQLFASDGWTVALNAVVTGVGDGTVSFGNENLPLAGQVTLVGTRDGRLSDLVGQTVDYTENAAGLLTSIEIAQADTRALSLNDDPAVALKAAAEVGGKVYAGTTYAVRSGENFFWLVLAGGGTVPLLDASVPVRLNGAPTPLDVAVPSPADDLVLVTLNGAGAATAVDVTDYDLGGLLATGTEGQWTGPGGDSVSVNFYQPGVGYSAVLLTPGAATHAYLNGNVVDLQTLFSVVRTDLAAGTYPLLGIAGSVAHPYAVAAWDQEVAGTVVSASRTAPGRTRLRLATSAGQVVSLPVDPLAWQASATPPELGTVSPGWFGSIAADAGKPGVYVERGGSVAWSWPLPARLEPGVRLVELRSAQQGAKGDVTWTVDHRGTAFTLSNDAGGQMTLNADPGAFYLVDVQPDGGVTDVEPLVEDAGPAGVPYTYTVQLVTTATDASGRTVLNATLGAASSPPGGQFATTPATTLSGVAVYGPPSFVVAPYARTLQAGAAVHVWYDPTRGRVVLQSAS
jgi:hypothetical protein